MKVSVIVPVYNCEDWLRQCIDSLLCEDSQCEQEIILVDDGVPTIQAESVMNTLPDIRV